MSGTAAILCFHGPLKDLLHPRFRSEGRVVYPADRRASVKDVVEALGPPHTEIGRIFAGGVKSGTELDFNALLRAGETLDILPVEPPMDVTRTTLLRPEPLPEIRFVVDVNAGKLATRLRLLGFDTAYANHLEDAAVAELAAKEQRIVLSKDRALLKRKAIAHGRLIRNEDPEQQLAETLRFFGLHPPFAPFSRCLRCNTPLQPVDKADVLHRLLPLTKKYFNEFHICPDCGRIYWPGSHHDQMLIRLEKMGIRQSILTLK